MRLPSRLANRASICLTTVWFVACLPPYTPPEVDAGFRSCLSSSECPDGLYCLHFSCRYLPEAGAEDLVRTVDAATDATYRDRALADLTVDRPGDAGTTDRPATSDAAVDSAPPDAVTELSGDAPQVDATRDGNTMDVPPAPDRPTTDHTASVDADSTDLPGDSPDATGDLPGVDAASPDGHTQD